ncbi:hypothetical protein CRE_06480 [Caenorhabditis remanei]|uniref:Uncharacterized protein n=1 Tax=Caenorhabditis remanei TaxID=31234 RepID=E3M1A8_CAERE|nr:hypothetical protein CRE_06480 [Caenorhabditis remanei]
MDGSVEEDHLTWGCVPPTRNKTVRRKMQPKNSSSNFTSRHHAAGTPTDPRAFWTIIDGSFNQGQLDKERTSSEKLLPEEHHHLINRTTPSIDGNNNCGQQYRRITTNNASNKKRQDNVPDNALLPARSEISRIRNPITFAAGSLSLHIEIFSSMMPPGQKNTFGQ